MIATDTKSPCYTETVTACKSLGLEHKTQDSYFLTPDYILVHFLRESLLQQPLWLSASLISFRQDIFLGVRDVIIPPKSSPGAII